MWFTVILVGYNSGVRNHYFGCVNTFIPNPGYQKVTIYTEWILDNFCPPCSAAGSFALYGPRNQVALLWFSSHTNDMASWFIKSSSIHHRVCVMINTSACMHATTRVHGYAPKRRNGRKHFVVLIESLLYAKWQVTWTIFSENIKMSLINFSEQNRVSRVFWMSLNRGCVMACYSGLGLPKWSDRLGLGRASTDDFESTHTRTRAHAYSHMKVWRVW